MYITQHVDNPNIQNADISEQLDELQRRRPSQSDDLLVRYLNIVHISWAYF